MSNAKIFLGTLIHFLFCISGLLVLQKIFIEPKLLPHSASWLWIALCAILIPSLLGITKDQLNWHKHHWVLLVIILFMIPFPRIPSNEVWHLPSILLFSLNQLCGPAVCEELYFRARFHQLTIHCKHSILISLFNGILFSSAHVILRGPGLLQFLTFIPGIVLWIIYRKNRNLWTVILLHWLLNTSFYAVFYRLELIFPDFFKRFLFNGI